MAEYDISDTTPKTGEYVCSSCGEMTEFERDDDFSVCPFCEDDNGKWVHAVVEDDDEKKEEDEFSDE